MMDNRRAARLDLGMIGAALASRILAECSLAIEVEVRRLTPALRHTQGLDPEDLHALGQIAVLEAYLTHEPEKGRTLRSWAGQVVRWRLVEAVQQAQSPEAGGNGAVCDAEPEDEAEDPATSYDEIEKLTWLQQAIGRLPPRQRTLLAARLRGETGREVGKTLGLGDVRASQVASGAIRLLYEQALDAGLVGG